MSQSVMRVAIGNRNNLSGHKIFRPNICVLYWLRKITANRTNVPSYKRIQVNNRMIYQLCTKKPAIGTMHPVMKTRAIEIIFLAHWLLNNKQKDRCPRL